MQRRGVISFNTIFQFIAKHVFFRYEGIDPCSVYVMFSHFRPRDVLKGILLYLFFLELFARRLVHMSTFDRVIPCDLKWENKTYKVKRSIMPFWLPYDRPRHQA